VGLIEKQPPLWQLPEISVRYQCQCCVLVYLVTAPLASQLEAGVGVGSAINQLNSEVAMIAAVRGLVEALAKSRLRLR